MGHIPVAQPSPIPRWTFPRRGLAIAFVLLGLIALIVVGIVAATPTGISRDSITGPGWVKGISVNDLQTDQPVHVLEAKAWLVKLRTGEVLALSHKDPRLGCTVPWRPDFTFRNIKGWFRNPCHSQTYDLTGACFDGPCIRGLDRYPTRVVNGVIEIHVGDSELIQGPPVDKGATPYVAGQ